MGYLICPPLSISLNLIVTKGQLANFLVLPSLVHFCFLFFGGGGRGIGHLLTFPTHSVGAYSRWALIRGWALNQINMIITSWSSDPHVWL